MGSEITGSTAAPIKLVQAQSFGYGWSRNMDRLSLVLVIIGALNWGSVGIFGFDFIGALFGGQMSTVSRVIFSIVGLAGIWSITLLFREREVVRREHE